MKHGWALPTACAACAQIDRGNALANAKESV